MKANPVKVGGYDILKVVRTGKCFNAYEIMLVRVYSGYVVLQKNSLGIAFIGDSSSPFTENQLLPLKSVPFTCVETLYSVLIPFIPFLVTFTMVEEAWVDGVAEVGGGAFGFFFEEVFAREMAGKHKRNSSLEKMKEDVNRGKAPVSTNKKDVKRGKSSNTTKKAFVSDAKACDNKEMCDEEAHDSLEEVAYAILREEKVMEVEKCDDNPNLLAIVPYVNPSSPLHQPSSHLAEPITPLSQILTSSETRNFASREWIDNMSILFAAGTFMYKEKCQTGSISRVIFSPMYTDKVIRDYAKRKVNGRVWSLLNYNEFFSNRLLSIHDLLTAKYLMTLVLHDNHWWCYALHWESKKLFVLDSQGYKLTTILFDCGIMVLKYLQHWEHHKKYNGQSEAAIVQARLHM
ncbi:hypothetical protein DEO72_LG6g1634 [Vigna unguiculata]|uniref:Ulp1 protease family n=1 Tax=Vigna unguiculata TaxID=3917 RepID=A0A4D6MAT7_VIGUN|nr:hypothetical protein DEO72_LG6g1634 [Vigna unguiculata]